MLFIAEHIFFDTWEKLRTNLELYGPRSLFGVASKSEITTTDTEKARKVIEYYVGSYENINKEHTQGLIDMYTDASFLYGTMKTISYLIKHNVTVYQYIFTYKGPFSFTQIFGVPHDPIGK